MKKKIITILVVVGIVFLLALPKLNFFSSKSAATAPAGGGPPALQVDAIIVKPGKLDNKLVITGSVQANESLELKSEISGKISGIFFKEGKQVKKGELLVEIKDDEILAQLEKEKHNQKLNQDNEYRQRKLLEKEAISQEEYDNALNRLNITQADIRLLQAQLEKTKIAAPFDGTVGLRFVSEGAFITSSTVIATLYSLNPAKIEFAVPARYSAQIATGKKILFAIENSTRVFEGEVYAVEPQIDPSTRTLRVRAVADNSDRALLPGQFVRVELILETVNGAMLVPSEAVIPELSGHKVYKYVKGMAEEVKVNIGVRTEKDVEIVTGLAPSDTLVTTGILQLRQGIPLSLGKIVNQ
jgi:membrane fusion protein (multidrug efflux system)